MEEILFGSKQLRFSVSEMWHLHNLLSDCQLITLNRKITLQDLYQHQILKEFHKRLMVKMVQRKECKMLLKSFELTALYDFLLMNRNNHLEALFRTLSSNVENKISLLNT